MKRQEKKRIQTQMDRVFSETVVAGRWVSARQYKVWHPPTDVHETGTHYVVLIEVAGMKESDFKISLTDRTLIVAGARPDPCTRKACYQIEIRYGEFRSEVVLPGPIDDESIEATYTDGFLRVELPRKPVQRVPVVEA